mmetsp:Transcript_13975/g.30876  ORF Transcript_13975/g.30876 Transcript_13975/m.30876 type:complete len:204 (-) Transcript_13975:1278-1889(-)
MTSMRSPLSSLPEKRKPCPSSRGTKSGFTSYRCRWRSSTEGCPPYSSDALLFGSSIDCRIPSRIVPPIFSVSPSGMNIMAESSADIPCANSQLLAPGRPRNVLQYSITAACIPKQIPKKGIFFSLAKRIASTFPSIPRIPKPPGTSMPCAEWSLSHAARCSSGSFMAHSSSRCDDSTITRFRRWEVDMHACLRAEMTLRYESN